MIKLYRVARNEKDVRTEVEYGADFYRTADAAWDVSYWVPTRSGLRLFSITIQEELSV